MSDIFFDFCSFIIRMKLSFTSGDAIDDAINRVSNVLPRGDEQAGSHKDGNGGLVVEPEDVVVNPDLLGLDEALDLTE